MKRVGLSVKSCISTSVGVGLRSRLPGIISDGLVAAWPFDEGEGTTAADISGNGHDITSMTGAWITGGFRGTAIVGPGSDLGIDGADVRTVCAVVRPDNITTPRIGGPEWPGDTPGTPTNGTRWTMRAKTSDTEFRLEVQGAGESFEDAGMDLIVDTWQFVAVTQSGDNLNTIVGYVDGASEASVTAAAINTDGNFQLFGVNNVAAPGGIGYGIVYNRALSAAEIATNRHALTLIMAQRGVTLP